MNFIICFSVAVIVLVAAVILALRKRTNKLLIVGAGVFIAMFVLFIPAGSGGNITNAITEIIVPLVRSIRVFGLNEDFLVSEFDFGELPLWFNVTYICVLDLLYFVAPLLTFSLILSVFGNSFSKIRLVFSAFNDIYVFSESNARSHSIAKDIAKNNPKAVIVFYNTENKPSDKKVIAFNSSITEISHFVLRFSKHITFFICSDDEDDNIRCTADMLKIVGACNGLAEKLKKNIKTNEGIDLYYFSTHNKSVSIFNNVDNHGVRVRKINEIQDVIYNFMYNKPMLNYVDSSKKQINLAVIGAGSYGEEFVKAALWSGQDLRYKLNINVFDIKPIKEQFSINYPELVNTEMLWDCNEINYKIKFFDNRDVFETKIEDISEMKSVRVVFVALGDNNKNYEASVYLRECFSRMGIKPEIYTITTDANLKDKEITTYKKEESYEIGFIYPHDIFSCQDRKVLEEMGKRLFAEWNGKKLSENNGDYSDFYHFDFHYRSSVAAAMFWDIRQRLYGNVKVTDENKRLEHWRWNAYTRTEGYRYGEPRDNIAKLHNNLKPYDELDEETKKFDEYPIRAAMSTGKRKK